MPHALQEYRQSTGQGVKLQGWRSGETGHDRPPYAGPRVTVAFLSCVPFPHIASQVVHCDQIYVQSIGADVVVSANVVLTWSVDMVVIVFVAMRSSVVVALACTFFVVFPVVLVAVDESGTLVELDGREGVYVISVVTIKVVLGGSSVTVVNITLVV